jgi:hypothetical protein
VKTPELYKNIDNKRKRIAKGSGEKMCKPVKPWAPTTKNFKDSEKNAQKSLISMGRV